MERIGRRLNQLPIILEVNYRGKKFGFVHADVPVEDWELLKEMQSKDIDYIQDSLYSLGCKGKFVCDASKIDSNIEYVLVDLV